MITSEQIVEAKWLTKYTPGEHPHHEHDDCIRIAYQWLAAQERTKGAQRRHYPIKHMIEQWAGRYVSQADVEVAAHLLGIMGRYPNFNISSRFIDPDVRRLDGISQANTQSQRQSHNPKSYARQEVY